MIHALPSAATDALAEHYDPDEMWLFGSRANGTAGEDSDWDVLLLLPDDADKSRQSAIPGNDILERAGIRGDVRHLSSEVFHSSVGVPNSLRRVIGDDIVLCYRRDGFLPQIMPQEAAAGRFVADLRQEAEEYLAAATFLSGKRYGQINLLRLAVRNILVALLTKAGIHAGGSAFGSRGLSVLLDLLPSELQNSSLAAGIGLFERLDGLDLADMHEFVAQPPAEDMAILDSLQDVLKEFIDRI
jgi:predicted nucleotidyltransferase